MKLNLKATHVASCIYIDIKTCASTSLAKYMPAYVALKLSLYSLPTDILNSNKGFSSEFLKRLRQNTYEGVYLWLFKYSEHLPLLYTVLGGIRNSADDEWDNGTGRKAKWRVTYSNPCTSTCHRMTYTAVGVAFVRLGNRYYNPTAVSSLAPDFRPVDPGSSCRPFPDYNSTS